MDDIQKRILKEVADLHTVPEFKDVVDELWDEIEEHQDGREAGIPFKFP